MSDYKVHYLTTYVALATVITCATFSVLKLSGDIAWSWWWVLSPVLLPVGVAFLLVILSLILLRTYGKR